ncbi:hypothetical protein [Sorangium sp. So ce1078]|uniref:hypothetical protein n=1 Tax=Sorangium sp. So ce1078 TaxID=3133329 RepID=UPI003F616377
MSSRLSKTVLPFVFLSAVSLAACQVDISLGGANTTSSSSGVGGGGDGGGGVGGFLPPTTVSGATTGTGAGGWDWPEYTPDKVDVLFVIDNSGSMADKQEILRLATADLVFNIVNPVCVHPTGEPVDESEQPETGFDACPVGTSRVRNPVHDMHIGVISSSLGGHGSGACSAMTSASNVDMAHLLARSSENSVPNDLPTYQDKGFLVWDPAGSHDPAGDSDVTTLYNKLGAIVEGVGQAGCGFEAPLESMYRFLVDPEPYATLAIQDDIAVPTGVDQTIMTQRRDFLRPDSLVLIVMLSDENDCSIRDEGRNYLVAETSRGFRLWRPRSECASDPNHECCRSCSQQQDGCPVDPACTGPDGVPARLSAAEDPVNLRCWDQKRRFGFDFLYPLERYTEALSWPLVASRVGDLVPNPLFMDPESGTLTRGPQHVIFTGILGVPWQDLARQDASGAPDLAQGLDDQGNPVGGLKSAAELSAPVTGSANDAWDIILGDPANNIPPADPFMIESMNPRSGANPITGDPIVQPSATGWNAINGREYTIPQGSTGDLQYACIFDVEERLCEGTTNSCDCRELIGGEVIDSPLCAPEGMNDPAEPLPRTTTQYKAKAYPGIRELQLLRSLGDQGITGSICPAQTSDPLSENGDYGYTPVIRAVLDRLNASL